MQEQCDRNRKCSGIRKKRRVTGSVSECICFNCGTRIPHKRGIPCFEEKCPKCGITMEKAKHLSSRKRISIWYAYL